LLLTLLLLPALLPAALTQQALERIPYSVSLWKAAIELVDEDDAKVGGWLAGAFDIIPFCDRSEAPQLFKLDSHNLSAQLLSQQQLHLVITIACTIPAQPQTVPRPKVAS
jgi:hypothetical protein